MVPVPGAPPPCPQGGVVEGGPFVVGHEALHGPGIGEELVGTRLHGCLLGLLVGGPGLLLAPTGEPVGVRAGHDVAADTTL